MNMSLFSSSRYSWLFVAALLLSLTLAGCFTEQIKPTYTLQLEEETRIEFPVPVAQYRSVAWLDDRTLVFVLRHTVSEVDFYDNYEIHLFDINTGVWTEVPLPDTPDNCARKPGYVKDLRSVPGGTFAYTYLCYNRGISGTLYIWDPVLNRINPHIVYDPPFAIDAFSFSPDRSQLIQEQAVGDGLNNQLHRVNASGKAEQILADFQRAADPAWSPDGSAIAFRGTRTNPHPSDDPKTWTQIENLYTHPWDLYLMDADGGNVRILYPEIGNPYHVRWSSDSRWLLFASRWRTLPRGVWMLDVETKDLVKLWSDPVPFALSPDNQHIVLLVEDDSDETEQGIGNYPVLFRIPPLPES